MHNNRPQFFALQSEDVRQIKQLRASIENTLHGAERVKALRMTVPVRRFMLDGTPMSCSELADFMIYAGDNFTGAGLAELPQIAACQGQPDLFARRWWKF